jgi:hypothetical protein
MSEFIERVRMLELDHEPNGWPAIQMRDLSAAAEEIERLQAEVSRLTMGLENCRLLAARHRKDPWALLVLGFCAEAGISGSITR